jgi:hypothetical protein
MHADTRTGRDATWERIEEERRRDRLVRRVSYIAWGVTLAVLLVFTTIVALKFVHTLELQRIGAVSGQTVVATIMPLVAVVGSVSLLIAILSTVGVFLRLRTASLSEIQLRLAALEDMLLEGSNNS